MLMMSVFCCVLLPAYDMGVSRALGEGERRGKKGRVYVQRAAEEEAAEEDDENHGEFLHGWLVGWSRAGDRSISLGWMVCGKRS